MEEGENCIICRVYDKTEKDYKDIGLKLFLMEFKKLEKQINQEKEREKFAVQKEVVDAKKNGEEEKEFLKMSRAKKHEVIRGILTKSVQLKLQLKRQLKALRDKKLIDLDTLNKTLKLTNLDDDTII